MLHVWSMCVHLWAMMSWDSVESTSCLVSQGVTAPGVGSGSRSPRYSPFLVDQIKN